MPESDIHAVEPWLCKMVAADLRAVFQTYPPTASQLDRMAADEVSSDAREDIIAVLRDWRDLYGVPGV